MIALITSRRRASTLPHSLCRAVGIVFNIYPNILVLEKITGTRMQCGEHIFDGESTFNKNKNKNKDNIHPSISHLQFEAFFLNARVRKKFG